MAKRGIPEVNAGSMADIAFLLLIFFLVTTTMDKDHAYIRSIPKNVIIEIPPEPVEKRNICAIQANAQNQLMIRGELMTNPDDISERVLDFYRENEAQNDPINNFPMYSRISRAEIQAALNLAIDEAEAVEKTPDASQDIIDFKYRQVAEWEKKQSAIDLLGKNVLPEIASQAHIRIEVQKATEYNLFATIQSEVEEAIFELRNDAALTVFKESYKQIQSRLAMDKAPVDRDKMELLKILYPDRIIEVTPRK